MELWRGGANELLKRPKSRQQKEIRPKLADSQVEGLAGWEQGVAPASSVITLGGGVGDSRRTSRVAKREKYAQSDSRKILYTFWQTTTETDAIRYGQLQILVLIRRRHQQKKAKNICMCFCWGERYKYILLHTWQYIKSVWLFGHFHPKEECVFKRSRRE